MSALPAFLPGFEASLPSAAPPCECGDCITCELRAMQARRRGVTIAKLVKEERIDLRLARRARSLLAHRRAVEAG